MQIITFDPKKNKIVHCGEFDTIKRRFLRICTSDHFMEVNQSYGIQENAIRKLKEVGCEIVVLATPTGYLQSKFDDWLAPDIKVQDFGHGKQRFMPVNRMERKGELNGSQNEGSNKT